MHRAEGVDRGRHDPLGAVRVPQIGDQLLGTTRCLEFGGRRAQLVVEDVDQQHRRAAFEQCGGDALAYALGGTGDDRDVAAHRVGVGVGHFAGPSCSGTPRCIS